MKNRFLAIVAGVTLFAAVQAATASGAHPYILNVEQMDRVTAGLTPSLDFDFLFTLGASRFDGIPDFGDDALPLTAILIDDTREGADPETGTAFQSTISLTSLGVRGSRTTFLRVGSFQTTVVF